MPNRSELDAPEYRAISKGPEGLGPDGEDAPSGDADGPFEITPELAQVRVVVNAGVLIDRGAPASTTVQWSNLRLQRVVSLWS